MMTREDWEEKMGHWYATHDFSQYTPEYYKNKYPEISDDMARGHSYLSMNKTIHTSQSVRPMSQEEYSRKMKERNI